MEGRGAEKPEGSSSPEKMICFFCKKEINLGRDYYSKDWVGGNNVWMHNVCRYEHPEEMKKAA